VAEAQIASIPFRDPVRGTGSGASAQGREKHLTPRSSKRSKAGNSVQRPVSLTRNAHLGAAKPEAAKLIGKIAAAASRPLGKVRAELIPHSTWKRVGKTLGPQAIQTTARLNHIFQFAQRIWGNERDAAAWLVSPHLELRGAAPYSLLRTEAGGRVVEALLGAIEYGFPI
jgi:putative toxin-antitoxin system antitoxin component (TIGR02293 family)